MKALEEKILKEGKILPGEIVMVGSFLNQQIDSAFCMEMGKEVARLFADQPITKILTIEASGIALALAASYAIGVPMVFAKKSKSANVDGAVWSAPVHSYTHNVDYEAVLKREYISADDSVLLVDDFLASGEAFNGMRILCEKAGAHVVGAAAAIEKRHQGGRQRLEDAGLRVESLAAIESMTDDSIVFAD